MPAVGVLEKDFNVASSFDVMTMCGHALTVSLSPCTCDLQWLCALCIHIFILSACSRLQQCKFVTSLVFLLFFDPKLCHLMFTRIKFKVVERNLHAHTDMHHGSVQVLYPQTYTYII